LIAYTGSTDRVSLVFLVEISLRVMLQGMSLVWLTCHALSVIARYIVGSRKLIFGNHYSVTEWRIRKLGRTRKTRTYRRPFTGAFGMGGGAISRCLEGLTCILQSLLSRYSITFSIHTTQPSLFLCRFGRITWPIFL